MGMMLRRRGPQEGTAPKANPSTKAEKGETPKTVKRQPKPKK